MYGLAMCFEFLRYAVSAMSAAFVVKIVEVFALYDKHVDVIYFSFCLYFILGLWHVVVANHSLVLFLGFRALFIMQSYLCFE